VPRFVTPDGRTIPRGGYRREDFIDDSATAQWTAARRPS
jgi:hypothetical protein